jgi:hypothetical protein
MNAATTSRGGNSRAGLVRTIAHWLEGDRAELPDEGASDRSTVPPDG